MSNESFKLLLFVSSEENVPLLLEGEKKKREMLFLARKKSILLEGRWCPLVSHKTTA